MVACTKQILLSFVIDRPKCSPKTGFDCETSKSWTMAAEKIGWFNCHILLKASRSGRQQGTATAHGVSIVRQAAIVCVREQSRLFCLVSNVAFEFLEWRLCSISLRHPSRDAFVRSFVGTMFVTWWWAANSCHSSSSSGWSVDECDNVQSRPSNNKRAHTTYMDVRWGCGALAIVFLCFDTSDYPFETTFHGWNTPPFID